MLSCFKDRYQLGNYIRYKNSNISFSGYENLYKGKYKDIGRKKYCVIERYGGWGCGNHGGGARAANIGGYQYKGIGLTPVSGETENVNYAHGTLALVEAVYEAIYSEVLGKVMPVGVAKCHGVLYTGKDTSFSYACDYQKGLDRTHGGILVREICERPGHYLRAWHFKVKEEFEELICDDVIRIRSVIAEFTNKFKNHNEFIAYMGKFLGACANQFGFARVAGLVHGGVTPSNLCVDGRWLDLSTTSFLDRGRNYLITHYPFYKEQEISLEILTEWVYTYCKYNGVDFDITTLVNYYQEQLQAYTQYHCGFALGLDRAAAASLESKPEYDQLSETLSQVLLPEGRVYQLEHLSFKEDDPLLCYLEANIAAIVDDLLSAQSKSPLLQVFKQLHRQDNSDYCLNAFIKRSFIKAFKRSYLASFFYRNQLMGSIDSIINANNIEAFSGFINSHISAADWIFTDEFSAREVIYENDKLVIGFDLELNVYRIICNGRPDQEFASIKELTDSDLIHDFDLFICNYNFMDYLQRLTANLLPLDNI